MKNYIVEEQESFNISEHYINFNSTHRVHWSDFDLTVVNSIYPALTLQFLLTIISKNNKH